MWNYEQNYKEIMDLTEEKACRIEESIHTLPSLDMFDKFALKACGHYCQKNCDYGFPNLILKEYKDCLVTEHRRNISNESSITFIQVCKISVVFLQNFESPVLNFKLLPSEVYMTTVEYTQCIVHSFLKPQLFS